MATATPTKKPAKKRAPAKAKVEKKSVTPKRRATDKDLPELGWHQVIANAALMAATELLNTYAAKPKEVSTGYTGPKWPTEGSLSDQLWRFFDQYKGKRADAIRAATALGFNPATAQTQYQHWRKYKLDINVMGPKNSN